MAALGADGAITIVVLALGLIVMMGDWLAPHLTFSLMVGVLMAARVIDTKAGASGFSNNGVLTVVVLYAVAEGVSQTGGLDRLMSRVLGTTATSGRAALIRMMLPVAISSAFLNNTPIVALMIPILISWGRRCNVSPKLLLLPLSYASIFGGTTTLIGTSTNLVISGLQSQRYKGTPDAEFNFFDITPYGLPYGVAGFAFVLLIGIFLLPKDTGSRPREDLLLAAAVGPSAGASVAGKPLPASGLLALSGLRLLWVSRKGRLLFKAAPAESARKASLLTKLLRPLLGRSSSSAAATAGASSLPASSSRGAGADALDRSGNHGQGTHVTVLVDEPINADDIILQEGDVLHFQGGLKLLQEEAERLGLVVLTSDLASVDAAAEAAASGARSLPPGASSLSGGKSPDVADGPDTAGGTGLRAGLKGALGLTRCSGPSGGLDIERVNRQATLGWSGATMWLFMARVRKHAPSIIGKTLDDVDFWSSYGVIVIGAELAGKKVPATRSLGELVLGAGDLLVFTARNDFDHTADAFAASFGQVEFLRDTKPKEFLMALRVKKGAAGKDIASNGLQDIAGLYVTAITRPGTNQTFHAISSTFELELGDILWFATDLDGVVYLLKDPRLEAVSGVDTPKLKGRQIYRHLVQATVSPDSALIGQTARQVRFRTYYEGVVLAIHRQSGYVSLQDVADVELNAGDILLLEADQGFKKRFQYNSAFGLVADVPKSSPLKTKLMWPALALTAAMVITQVISGFTGVSYIDLWPAAILTAAAMLFIGCMNSDQAIGAIDWTVYITIAFAFGVSAAMEKSGVAAAIASVFVTISKAIGGRTAALGAMYLVTGLLSEVLTNNAAAALMYPIAANVGDDMGIQPKIMSVAVMLGASAAFISPFGYQCNLMVFTAGQYKTMDFVRVGVFLQVWQLVAACIILSLPNHWMVLCGISLAFVLLAVLYAVAVSVLAKRRAAKVKAARLSSGSTKE